MWNKRKEVNLNHSLQDAQCVQQLTKTTRKGMKGGNYRRIEDGSMKRSA